MYLQTVGVSIKFSLVKANILRLSNNRSQHGKATEVTAMQTQTGWTDKCSLLLEWGQTKIALPPILGTAVWRQKLKKNQGNKNLLTFGLLVACSNWYFSFLFFSSFLWLFWHKFVCFSGLVFFFSILPVFIVQGSDFDSGCLFCREGTLFLESQTDIVLHENYFRLSLLRFGYNSLAH